MYQSVTRAQLSENVEEILSLRDDFVTLERDELGITVRMYRSEDDLEAAWTRALAKDDDPPLGGSLVVQGRFVVVPIPTEGERQDLWVIDTRENKESVLQLQGYFGGAANGPSPDTMIVAEHDPSGDGLAPRTRLELENMKTGTRRHVAGAPGQLDVCSLSEDRQSVYALQPYAEVGPSKLVSISLKTSRVTALRENVYSFYACPEPPLDGVWVVQYADLNFTKKQVVFGGDGTYREVATGLTGKFDRTESGLIFRSGPLVGLEVQGGPDSFVVNVPEGTSVVRLHSPPKHMGLSTVRKRPSGWWY